RHAKSVVVGWLILGGFGSFTVAADAPGPGKQVATGTTVKVKADEGERETTLRYLLYLPNEYESKASAKWPLVLFLHGSAQRGDAIQKAKIHAPPKLAPP